MTVDWVTREPSTWQSPSPRLPDVLCKKRRAGRALGRGLFLLDPASGSLLIIQIRNRCVEAEHLILIPQCVFFK